MTVTKKKFLEQEGLINPKPDYLRSDPLFRRVVRLTRIPHRTKLSTALKQFGSDSLKAPAEFNSQLVVEKLQELGLDEITRVGIKFIHFRYC